MGAAWDRWVERVNGPDPAPRPNPDPVPDEDDEPLALRDVLAAAAAFVAMGGALLLLHRIIHFNWGWVPWKQLAAVGLVLAAAARWVVQGVRALVRRMRGLPPPEREPTKRDRIAEKLRDLDEPYLRRERALRD